MPRASGTSLESLSPFQPHCTQIDCFRDSNPNESGGLSVKAAAGACLSLDGLPGRKYLCCPGYNHLQQWLPTKDAFIFEKSLIFVQFI